MKIYLRELGKYILLMLVMILLTASIIVDAVGQVKAERIINSFTGEKTRFVIHLTGKPHYTVTPDWLDNTISVSLSGVDHSGLDNDEIENCKNYIVKSAKLSGNSNGLNFLIRTNGEFKVKYDFLKDRNRLYIDVYRNFESVDLKTMLARASAYEDRGDHTNAAVQYEQALSLNPGSDKIKYSIALNQIKSGDTGKAIDRLWEIGPESGYYSSAQDLIGQQRTKKAEEKPVAVVKPEPENSNPKAGSDVQDKKPSEPAVQNNSKTNNKQEENGSEAEEINQDKDSAESGSDIVPVTKTIPTEEEKNEAIKKSTGISNILKKSGVENYILAGLYVILVLLITVVIYMGKRIFTMNRRSRKKTKVKAGKKRKSRKTIPGMAKGKRAVRDPLVDKTKLEEIQSFAKKLSKAYTKTDLETKKKAVKPIPARSNMKEMQEEHNVRIENVFEREGDLLNIDSEAVNLIKKFKNENTPSSGDKYEAIKQLAQQGWEVWEIARELGVGSEEIKIALEMGDSQQGAFGEEELYSKIYSLADLKLTASAIAERLRIGEEEVKLALKMRKTEEDVYS